MIKVDWRPFDYDNREATLPPRDLWNELVWIHEEDYHGVIPGYYDGAVWNTFAGSDDVSVTHWAPIEYPDAPQ